MTTRRAAALPAAALLLVACGGGPWLTQGEFARAASRICRDASTRMAHLTVPSFADGRPAARALVRVSERGRDALDDLRDLRGPKVDAALIEAWLAVLDQAIDEVDVAADALEHGDHRAAGEAATRAEALDRRGRELGRDYDVAPCLLTGALPDD